MSYVGDARQDTMLTRRSIRAAALWKITRIDGTILRLTDHDRDITYANNVYVSAAAPMVTDREAGAGLEGGGSSFEGAFASGKVTEDDLLAGLYSDAQVDEYIVDWKYPDVVGPLLSRRFWITRCKRLDHKWTAELIPLAERLARRSGGTVTRRCINTLGAGTCGLGVDLESAAYKKSGTVATVLDARRSFNAGAMGAGANLFTNGTIEWLTGNNAGLRVDIKSYTLATELFILPLRLAKDIQVGDTFYARAGCDYEFDGDCLSKFNNRINFKGAPEMPGTAKAARISV